MTSIQKIEAAFSTLLAKLEEFVPGHLMPDVTRVVTDTHQTVQDVAQEVKDVDTTIADATGTDATVAGTAANLGSTGTGDATSVNPTVSDVPAAGANKF
jgi:hypothetical protein